MASEIRCPHCGQTYGLSAEQVPQYSGQTITCTKCQKAFTVPALTAPPGTPPAYPQPMAAQPSGPVPAQQVGYATPQYLQQQSNGMAIASLVCGVVGFCVPVISSILAIIFGIVGLRKTRDPAVGGKGLAIAGISLGALGLVAIPCMISIMLPSLSRARETANRVKCAYNMKVIGQAMLLYANDNRGNYPPGLPELIVDQQLSAEVLVCPSSDLSAATGMTPAQLAQAVAAGGVSSYVYVARGLTTNAGADTILLYEPMTDHNDGGNFLYGDGHVDYQAKAMAERTIAQLKSGQNPPR